MAAIEIQDACDCLPCRDTRLVRPLITQPKSMGKGVERVRNPCVPASNQ
ncbi:hypothetical protein [Segatella maculosa]|nr:hypothetical protein [Segatella maculosa]